MSERRDHSRNHIGKVRIELCAKSFYFAGVRRFGEAQAEQSSRTLLRPRTTPLRVSFVRPAAIGMEGPESLRWFREQGGTDPDIRELVL
jgi:hypothetical protein